MATGENAASYEKIHRKLTPAYIVRDPTSSDLFLDPRKLSIIGGTYSSGIGVILLLLLTTDLKFS